MDRRYTQKLPKIELHAHLSGSISRQCLHEIYWDKKTTLPQDFNLDDPTVAIPQGKVDYDLKTFFPLFNQYIYKLCSDIPTILRTTLSVLANFEADGVVYLELRTTPRVIKQYSISKRRYVETVLSAIEEYERDPEHKMKTKLILSIDRRHNLMEAIEVVDVACQLRDRGIVGIDLCGDPLVRPIQHLGPAFLQAKLAGFFITIHFGEAILDQAELETMLSWQPDRIGHVIHTNPCIDERILEKNLGLELCISCNVHARMITGTFSDHHFGKWKEHTTRVALCTDDVGIFGSPLSNEYFLAGRHFKINRDGLKKLSENVIEMIFGGEDEKARLRKLFSEWEYVEENSQ